MMKRLLIALAMAAAVSVAFAKVTHTNDFEASWADLVPSVADEDASELLDHESAPSVAVPYPFSGFGEKYLSLDTGDATLWYTNTTAGNVYFDMAMQFNPSASAPELDDGTKIAFYLNTSSNLVVLAGPLSGENPTAYVTSASLDPEAWGRITISAKLVNGGLVFNAFLNGVQISASGTSDFPCLTSDTTIQTVGFKGSGALDDFVARTTDPFILNPAATIGGEGYATLADALADAESDSVVTLQANAAAISGLAAGTTYKIALNDYTFGGFTGADGVAVTASGPDANGVTTYSAVAGVAALNGVWYASFAEAYSHASAQSDTLQVKIDGDFVPVFENPSANNTRTFETITFTTTNTAAENIAIATTDGHSVIKTGKWTFPQNATLTVSASMTVTSVTGGTLNIPAPIALTMSSYDSIAGIARLTGDGVINAFNHGNFLLFPNDPLPVLLRKADWTGTLAIGSVFYAAGQSSVDWNPDNFGNTGSTIRFTGSAFDSFSAGTKSVNIELAGDGLSITGGVGRACELGGRLSGSGALTLSDNTGSLLLSGDVSGFTGNVTAAGTSSAITFGSSTTGNGQRIVVSAGESVTNAASATWTAANVIVLGELVANGTISLASGGKLWGDKGTGVYRANNSAAAIAVAPSWNGTYVIGWAGANGTAINFNSYGNSGSKIVVPEGSTLQGYIDVTANNTLTNNAEVVVNGVLNLSNGYNYSTVVWRKLSGSGTVKYAFAPTNWIKEKILELDRFTGSIEVSGTTQLEIESVNLSADAVANVRVVPIAVTSGGTVDGDMIVKVNGTENGQKLKYRADGLYVAIDIAIPAVDNMTASVTVDGVDTAIVDGGVAVASGARVVVTYTANEGYVGSGEVVIESASASSVVDTTGISATTAVAQVGETKYGSLKSAVDAATAGQTVAVLANCTVAAPITFNCGITVSNDYTVSVEADYALRFANGSTPVTVCGTGSFVWNAGKGSPFIVGNNEETAKQSYGITGLYYGSMILAGATIRTGSVNSGNMIKVEYGSLVMNSGVISGNPSRCVKADAENGDVTATVTINGGVLNQTASNKKAAEASAKGNGVATVTINAGDITGSLHGLTIPGTSTARFNADRTALCEAGYGTKLVGDWYVVAPMYAIKFISGEGSTTNDVATFEDDMPVAPTPAEVAGKAFSAWDPAIVAATAAATYTALYTNNVYTITLDANGGTVDPASINYTAETAAFDLPIATTTNDGVLFAGWTNETITVAFTNFVPGTTAALGDLTLYAKWDAIAPTPTYPSYINPNDSTIVNQYTAWANTYGADTGSAYEADFLLNVAPDTVGATINATDVSISGTTVTIDINRGNLNGYPYVKKAATVAGLASADAEAITIVPADQVEGLSSGGRITLTGESDAAQFYQIGVQVAPVAVPNNQD